MRLSAGMQAHHVAHSMLASGHSLRQDLFVHNKFCGLRPSMLGTLL